MDSTTVISLTKWCKGCQRDRPLKEFHNNKAAKDGKQSKCKECQAGWARENAEHIRIYKQGYRKRNAERLGQNDRASHLRRRFSLTAEQFDALLASQGGVCGCCGRTELGNGNWHVDHDHSCCSGKFTCGNCIRGILCPRCNKGIGMFEDNSALLYAAYAYIDRAKPQASRLIKTPDIGEIKRSNS